MGWSIIFIKEVIDIFLWWIGVDIFVLVGDVEEIDFEDWTDEEEVSLGGGR